MDPADVRSRKRLAVRPLLTVVLAVLVLNAAGWAVDLSPLRQEDESFGYAFAAFFLGMYAVPAVIVTAACALLAFAVSDPRKLAACTWIGSIASGAAGAALGVLVVPTLGPSPAGTVFGLVALAVTVALLAPLMTCMRRRRQPAGLS